MVCGYMKHGKTTLCSHTLKSIHSTDINVLKEEIKGKYYQLVYTAQFSEDASSISKDITLKDYPLAYVLKLDTHKRLGLDIPESLWDTFKDTVSILDIDTRKYEKLRYFYIKYAKQICDINPSYYADCVIANIKKNFNKDTIYSVSDWRKPIEYETIMKTQLPVSTVRIFRSSVVIPDDDYPLEHLLDKFQTTSLYVQSVEDFHKAVTIWPQYADYQLVGALVAV